MRRSLCVFALCLAALSCTGPAGEEGPAGEQGPQGAQGPEGPLALPPRITSLSPRWGSASTEVTIEGENFSTDLSQLRVTFDGSLATVVSAFPTRLVVKPQASTSRARHVAVSVEVARQSSNAASFELVPSGEARALDLPLLSSPLGAVQIGGELFIAGGALTSPSAGLYKRDADGLISRVFSVRSLEVDPGSGPMTVYDAPVALATDGTELWYATAFGSVRRYSPSTGQVTEVLGPNGNANGFPSITGLAISSTGTLFVAYPDLGGNSAVVRVATSGNATTIGGLGGTIHGLWLEGTDLFVSVSSSGEVTRIANAATTATVTTGFATGAVQPKGIAVVSGMLVVSDDSSRLLAVSRTSGGALAVYQASTGYVYRADSLWASSTGELLLSQGEGHVVRQVSSSGAASIVAAGVRLAFGTLRHESNWYVAGPGPSLFGGPPKPGDSVLLQLNDAGQSRVLLQGELFFGLTVLPGNKLAVADCLASKVLSYDLSAGTVEELLTSSDGISCPAGLAANATGELFYVDTVLNGTTATVGKKSSSGVTSSFATGLSGSELLLGLANQKLISVSLGLGSNSTAYSVDAATGGAFSLLTPASTLGQVMAMGTTATGTVLVGRLSGDLLAIDPLTGVLTPRGSLLVGSAISGGGPQALFFAIATLPDGTAVVSDYVQQQLVAVAP